MKPTDHNINKLLDEAGLNEPRKTGAVAKASGTVAKETAPERPIVNDAAVTKKNAAPRFPQFDEAEKGEEAQNDITLLDGVNVKVQVLLGRSRLTVEEILKLGSGSVVELDKLAGEPLDILVNDKLVAQGEVLVLNENFCIRVTDIVPPEERN
jgi:flagellar motor switch protein FliN/FliY